jgi:hypothetical protein
MCGPNLRTRLFGASVLLIMAAHGLSAAVFYVAPTGADTNPGTTTSPFRTIQRGVNALRSGYTLLIKPGTYSEQVNLGRLGNPTLPITIAAVTSGTVTVNGGHAGWTMGAETSVGNLQIRGLTITNGLTGLLFLYASRLSLTDMAIYGCGDAVIIRDGVQVTLTNVYAHNNDRGILLNYGGSLGINGLLVQNCTASVNGGSGGDKDGFAVLDFCTHVIVRDCVAYGNGGSGFDVKPESTRFDRCLSRNNGEWGFEFDRGPNVVTNCLSHHNGWQGFWAQGEGFSFCNCTSANNAKGALWLQSDIPTTTTVSNCIFSLSPVVITGLTMYTDKSNLYYTAPNQPMLKIGTSTWYIGKLRNGRAPLGSRSKVGNPLFISPTQGNYGLAAGSPAIGAGLWSSLVGTDLLGRTRNPNLPPDLGALEYVP